MAVLSHPFADLFPMLGAADAEALRADIAANGLRERIVVYEGRILDGRNRYLALYGLDDRELPPAGDDLWASTFRRFVPAQDGDPLAWVLSKNLHRRHLSETQRAIVADKLATLSVGRPSNSDGNSANLQNIPRAEAADLLHVSERTIASVHVAREKGSAELAEAMERGDVSASVAESATKVLSPAEQIRALQEQSPREFAAFVKEKRREKQDEKKALRTDREAELGARIMALPDKRYGVILADPEWQFETFSAETGMDRSADNHYPTSSLAVIKSRPVADIAADDCALLLWATVPMLPQALEVMAAWGFSYKSHAVWMKDQVGTGYWFRNQHELLLLGTRGKVPAPAMGEQFRSAMAFPVAEHSAKPPFAHDLAEAYWPSLPRIELNARATRPGWDAWGLEAPEVIHEASESIAIGFDAARPILETKYDGSNAKALAEELGRPIGTVRTWLFRAGLTDRARLAGNATHLGNHLKKRQDV